MRAAAEIERDSRPDQGRRTNVTPWGTFRALVLKLPATPALDLLCLLHPSLTPRVRERAGKATRHRRIRASLSPGFKAYEVRLRPTNTTMSVWHADGLLLLWLVPQMRRPGSWCKRVL